MAKKVLILSASIGTGHVRAAQALEKALKAFDPSAKIRNEDALDFVNPPFAKFYRKAYSDLVSNAPELMGLIVERSEKNWAPNEHGIAIERWNSQPLIKAVTRERPDVVICTHPLPADMISWLICQKRLWSQHAIVITDFDLNPMWLCQHYSRYFVAIEEAKQYLSQIGYNPENIVVSGIPIDPIFSIEKEKQAMRLKHGLDPDANVLLLSAGGLGVGPVLEVVDLLRQLPGRNQLIAMCGRNADLEDKLNSYKNSCTDSNLIVSGFSTEIDEYMACADLIVGKPGGLTSSEALARGLVFAIVDPIPGQEELNADHLLEEGAAIRCNKLEVIPFKIASLLGNRGRLETMRKAARSFASPDSADIIASSVLGTNGFETWKAAVHPSSHACESSMALTSWNPNQNNLAQGLRYRIFQSLLPFIIPNTH